MLLCLSGWVCGCGSQTISTVGYLEISGQVIRKGKPLPYAEVVFVPTRGKPTGAETLNAQSDKDGKFKLPLVPAGEYKVLVDVMVKGAADPALQAYGAETPLRAEVSPEKTAFEFNIDA